LLSAPASKLIVSYGLIVVPLTVPSTVPTFPKDTLYFPAVTVPAALSLRTLVTLASGLILIVTPVIALITSAIPCIERRSYSSYLRMSLYYQLT
jgi:hypothetical protein